MTTDVDLAVLDTDAAKARTSDIQALYEEVFAEPPHSEGPDEFEQFTTRWWPRQLGEPGFLLITADDPDGRLVGATYGHRLSPDTSWWDGALEPIPEADDTTATAAIIEMMVRKRWRRGGLATAMHHRWLAARDEPRVTLLVRPENQPAREAYLGWGYRRVGQIRPARTAPVYDAMILDRS